jgi:U4/U6.U5 tri-snRNP-associated protein 1
VLTWALRLVAEEKEQATNGFDDLDPKEEPEEGGEGEGLVFDDTSEFVRSIVFDPQQQQQQRQPQTSAAKQQVKVEGTTEGKSIKATVEEDIEELEAGEVDMKEEEDEEGVLHAMQVDGEVGEEVKKEEGEVRSLHFTSPPSFSH